MPDCKTNGWILLGSPLTLEQLNLKKEFYGQTPSLVVAMDMSDHLIYEKLEQRRWDPVTNKEYYILN